MVSGDGVIVLADQKFILLCHKLGDNLTKMCSLGCFSHHTFSCMNTLSEYNMLTK